MKKKSAILMFAAFLLASVSLSGCSCQGGKSKQESNTVSTVETQSTQEDSSKATEVISRVEEAADANGNSAGNSDEAPIIALSELDDDSTTANSAEKEGDASAPAEQPATQPTQVPAQENSENSEPGSADSPELPENPGNEPGEQPDNEGEMITHF